MTNEEYQENMLQLASAQYIQLCRIYDMLTLLVPEDKSVKLMDFHIEGKTLSPAPFLVDDEDAEI